MPLKPLDSINKCIPLFPFSHTAHVALGVCERLNRIFIGLVDH